LNLGPLTWQSSTSPYLDHRAPIVMGITMMTMMVVLFYYDNDDRDDDE